ncbi:MAG: SOS response-associated peptidase family protein [Actinobacteria bacterium]|nr:SOS response-associated peptidase family protein [Actinomycetota bacterium]
MITLEPTPIIAEIHNRMPFVLEDAAVKAWLDPENTEFEKLMEMIRPISSEDLERTPSPC